jgi:hypothetical protein
VINVGYDDGVEGEALLTGFEGRVSHAMATIEKTDATVIEMGLNTRELIACSP